MKRKVVFSLVLVLFAFGVLNSFPAANYGNVRVPDAYVMPHTMARISLLNYIGPEYGSRHADSDYNWGLALNAGLFNYGEIGIVATGDEVVYAHLKARLLKESLMMPDIAFGIDNLFSKVPAKHPGREHPDIGFPASYRRNSLYVSLSKTILITGIPVVGTLPTRVTAGFGGHRFHTSRRSLRDYRGPFGAVQIEPFKRLVVTGEIDGLNANAGFEYRMPNYGVQLAFYNVEDFIARSRDLMIGINLSYVFDRFVADSDRRYQMPLYGVERELIQEREGAGLDELQRIRRQRRMAEDELEEIRRLLQE